MSRARGVGTALPAAILSVVLTLLAADYGAFSSLENFSWKVVQTLERSPEDSTSSVVLVVIDDDELQREYGGLRPLDPTKLGFLLDAIAACGPKSIGVVLDTSDSRYSSLAAHAFAVPVVWSRGAAYSERKEVFDLISALGRPPNQSGSLRLGVSSFASDEDKVVRRAARVVPTANGFAATLPWALLRAANWDKGKTRDDAALRLLSSRGRPVGKDVLNAKEVRERLIQPGWRSDGPLHDKLVLVGLTAGAQDEWETPLGWMNALELNAWALETELTGGGAEKPGRFASFLLALFSGIGLLLALEGVSLWKGVVRALGLTVAFAVACSLVTVRSLAYVWYFLPVLGAVLLHELYNRAQDERKKLVFAAGKALGGSPKPRPPPLWFAKARIKPRRAEHKRRAGEDGVEGLES